jgi:glycosyltransferase involved in cell wall biosynthesis
MGRGNRVIPLVSILIPAFNSAEWIGQSIRSALAQTWTETEIIVVDDGSTDDTVAVAQTFQSPRVSVHAETHGGASAARNKAFALSHGQYIQWLDADDVLEPRKIEHQMTAIIAGSDPKVMHSSAWGVFAYRLSKARFVPTSLWRDLSPAEWMIRKFGEGVFMQTATWLTSRALAEEAGPWDTRLSNDDDGEYFARLLTKSTAVRFAPDARVYYRSLPSARLSYIGRSEERIASALLSVRLQIRYFRSLDDSVRAREACLRYLLNRSVIIPPDRNDFRELLVDMASELGFDTVDFPKLRRKYRWLIPLVGENMAWQARQEVPRFREAIACTWDKLLSE